MLPIVIIASVDAGLTRVLTALETIHLFRTSDSFSRMSAVSKLMWACHAFCTFKGSVPIGEAYFAYP